MGVRRQGEPHPAEGDWRWTNKAKRKTEFMKEISSNTSKGWSAMMSNIIAKLTYC